MMKYIVRITWIALILISCQSGGPSTGAMKTEMDSLSYAVGMNIGYNYKMQKVDLDASFLYAGFKAVMDSTNIELSQEKMNLVLNDFIQKRQRENMVQAGLVAAENEIKAQKFLEKNSKNENVQTTPSGLQIEVLEEGEGISPDLYDVVKFHFKASFADGNEFANTYVEGPPVEAMVSELLPGQTEALQMMKKGAKWKLFVPPGLAHGQEGMQGIPPNSLLIFEIELLDVLK